MLHENVEKLEKKVKSAICKFIADTLVYQYAVFVEEKKLKYVSDVFVKDQINKDGSLNWKKIKKSKLEKKP